jgi:hypothetical protein
MQPEPTTFEQHRPPPWLSFRTCWQTAHAATTTSLRMQGSALHAFIRYANCAGQLRYDPELGMVEVQGHREYGLYRRARSAWPSRRLLSKPWRSTRSPPNSARPPNTCARARRNCGPRTSTTGSTRTAHPRPCHAATAMRAAVAQGRPRRLLLGDEYPGEFMRALRAA